jgi:anti-sigma factor RsiW
MHGSVRDRLEDLLAAGRGTAENDDLARHLSSCSECSWELASMRAQSELLQSLRAPEDVEPAPGFYARVLQRIEERAKDSAWAVFIYSPISKRLVYASLTLALMLGTYVITQERRDGHLGETRIVAQQLQDYPLVVGSQAEQRDAVLANFASRSGSPR